MNAMNFHPCTFACGIRPDRVAARRFKAWLTRLLDEWDFAHMVTAHNGNLLVEAKSYVRRALEQAEGDIQAHALKYKDVPDLESAKEGRTNACIDALFRNDDEGIDVECG